LLPLLDDDPDEADGSGLSAASGAMHSSPDSSSEVASVVLETLDEIES